MKIYLKKGGKRRDLKILPKAADGHNTPIERDERRINEVKEISQIFCDFIIKHKK
jgi:hypothetical protein